MFENKVIIEVIDKETGKVKQKVELKNAILKNAATDIIGLFTGSVSYTGPLEKYVYLWNTTTSKIKELPIGWNTSYVDTGTAIQNTGTATDSSSDSYTVNYVELRFASGGTTYGDLTTDFASKLSSPVTKASADVLKVTWVISVPYSSPPT